MLLKRGTALLQTLDNDMFEESNVTRHSLLAAYLQPPKKTTNLNLGFHLASQSFPADFPLLLLIRITSEIIGEEKDE